MRTVRITAPGDRIVGTHCEIADKTFTRMRGLLGRRGLEPGTGMVIDQSPSVMTFFMRFPIDVVFLDRDKAIVGISHTLRPWRLAGARRAVAALELPAGTAAKLGLAVGERLEFTPVEPGRSPA